MVRPERFGAVGDGRHDDTEAIQRALSVAHRMGAGVLLGAHRTYRCTHEIDVYSNTFLRGHGDTSVLSFTWVKNTSATDGFYVGNVNQTSGDHDIVLDNFAIRGAGSGLPSGPQSVNPVPNVPGIRFRLVSHFRLSRLDVSRVPGMSVLYQGSSDGVIRGNRVYRSGRDGITGTWFRRGVRRVLVAHNDIVNVGDDAVGVVCTSGDRTSVQPGAAHVVVRDNRIRGWRSNPNGLAIGRGISVLACRNVDVVGNSINRTHSFGILVAHAPDRGLAGTVDGVSENILVAGNVVRSAGQNYPGSSDVVDQPGGVGIAVRGARGVVLRHNTVSNSYDVPVDVRSCRSCSVDK
jgi:polygalacturonase